MIISQKRNFVKIFVFSVCDFLLYLQKRTDKVVILGRKLQRRCAMYVLRINIAIGSVPRAFSIYRLLLMLARRKLHRIKTIEKIIHRAMASDARERDQTKRNTIKRTQQSNHR